MALVLETGDGLANANSYATEAMADTYFDDRGNATWANSSGDKEAALIRATQWIDGHYRARFQGYRRFFRAQALEWPRYSVVDSNGVWVDYKTIPVEIKSATCEAALRELVKAGSLSPDLKRGGAIDAVKAGSVAVNFSPSASSTTTFVAIDMILTSLLGFESPFSLSSSRG